MSRKVFILLCLFILSRLIFINPLPVFFDSPEYLSRFSNPNYLQAIISGHIPYHISYVALFWPIFQIASFFYTTPSLIIIIAQIIFSTIAIYCTFLFVRIITNKNTAFLTTLFGASLPLYWITNVSIMQECTYVNFFLISLFFITAYAKKKNNSIPCLVIGFISLGLSLLTHPVIILWLPFLLSVIYFLDKEKVPVVFFVITIATFLAILVNGLFVAISLQISLPSGIHKYLSPETNILPNISSLLMILRFIRNGFSPILQNTSVIIFIITMISLIKTFKINKKLFILAFLWISPSLISNQWFNPLLSGRHAIIAEFGFAFLLALYFEKRKISSLLILVYILIVFLPALILLRQPIPYLTEQKFIQTLPKGLLIDSHFARPQIQRNYNGIIYFVNEPSENKKLGKIIDEYLINKIPVFITSQALSDPYGLYSGPFLLPLSLSYMGKFELGNIMSSYSIKKYAIIDEDAGLILYNIVLKKTSKYPNIPVLKYNRRQINYFDPINRLWFFVERAKIIQIHNMIKG